ncbi:hypothetical protein IAT38_003227 [Cryptococcus sp. DSM 104549]
MPDKICTNCKSNKLVTDYSAGNVVCTDCGQIDEENILVSEVGFAEGSGGRVHVQGAFVSNHATGVAGMRGGRGSSQNSDALKASGKNMIRKLGTDMRIDLSVVNFASRVWELVVDNKFNRGRKQDYVYASCVYLACRQKKNPSMLIDFSEHLSINVFELGATYLKLRTTLNIKMDHEVDPAIYNLRFAHKLNFGPSTNTIAADASRLVRRFRADWMTQGRRPAGVCGAALIIAGRMSNFLRTPDEVALVVKVHPTTIKQRLKEFSKTGAGSMTVADFRGMDEDALDKVDETALPPIVREQQRKKMLEQLKAELAAQQSEAGSEWGGEGSARKRRKVNSGSPAPSDVRSRRSSEDLDDQDEDLPAFGGAEYFPELEAARDDPEAARKERMRERASYMKGVRGLHKIGEEGMVEDLDLDLDADAEMDEESLARLADRAERLEDDDERENEEVEYDEEGNVVSGGDADPDDLPPDSVVEPTQLKTLTQAGKKPLDFNDWHDEDAVIELFKNKFFTGEELLYQGAAFKDRVKLWWGARDPREIYAEMEAIRRARYVRDRHAKVRDEDANLDDLDDEELEQYFHLEEDERDVRARVWLSVNGKWLEQEKVRLEKRDAYNKTHKNENSKPKPKRKRAAPHKGPHETIEDTIVATTKKYSKRVNYEIMRRLGYIPSSSAGDNPMLKPPGDEKYDEDDDDDEKDDEEEDEEEY